MSIFEKLYKSDAGVIFIIIMMFMLYCFIGGATYSFLARSHVPHKGVCSCNEGYIVSGILWPVTVPVALGTYLFSGE